MISGDRVKHSKCSAPRCAHVYVSEKQELLGPPLHSSLEGLGEPGSHHRAAGSCGSFPTHGFKDWPLTQDGGEMNTACPDQLLTVGTVENIFSLQKNARAIGWSSAVPRGAGR